MRYKFRCSGFKRSIIHPTKFNTLSDNSLLRDVDDVLVVWLDGNLNRSEDCVDTELELRRLSVNLKTFSDLNDCLNYFTSPSSEHNRIFVIVSGALGNALIERVQNFESIVSIYVFCENEPLHSEWAKQYAKIKGVFIEKERLFSELLPDLLSYSAQLTPMRIFQTDDKQKSIHDLSEESASFMWFQLLIRILLTLRDNRDDRAKKDLIDTCLQRYQGDTHEQNRIKDFEQNYQFGQAIQWYTKDTFLYRSVNRALRTADIDIIYRFRFIIAEIHDQLSALPRPSTFPLVVYRGQVISRADMEIIKVNQNQGFISMNTFLSTSESGGQATGFSAAGTGIPETLVSVLFKINVDQCRQPFAKVDTLSAMPTENEILFSIGTVFRIDEVEEYDSGSIVHLTLTTEIEERFESLISLIISDIGPSPVLATFGRFLFIQGDYNRAERYFQFLLDVNEPDLDDLGREVCYTSLGDIADEKGEYERAMDYYQQVLSSQQRRLPQNHPSLAKMHRNIGIIHMALGQHTEGIQSFQLSLSIDLMSEPEDQAEVPSHYNNMALMYQELGDYSNAKIYFEKSLEKDKEFGLDVIKHPSTAATYYNLGSLCADMQQYRTAIEYYEKALEIQKASLPPEHSSRIQTESSMSSAYFQLGDYKTALEIRLRVLDARLKVQPPNFPSLVKTYTILSQINQELGDFTRAEGHIKRSLQICQGHLNNDHPDMAITYDALGNLYDGMGKSKKAFDSYQQALDIWQKQKSPNVSAISQAYINLSSVEENPQKAMEYAKKGLNILLSADSADKQLLVYAYNALGQVCKNDEQLDEAIENYTKALDLARESVNGDDNDPSLSTYYHNLGSAFGEQGDYERALTYIHKALDNKLKVQDSNHPHMGALYNNLAALYSELEQNDRAIEYYQKAIDVFKQPNAQNFRRLARCYESMGSVYEVLADRQKTLDYYRMALDLQLAELELHDPDLVSTYSSLASVYEERGDYQAALTHFIPMLNIQEKILSSSDLNLAEDYERVGTCYHRNRQYHLAIEHYKKALAIQQENRSPLASIYQSLADACEDFGELDAAMNYYEMGIESLKTEKGKERTIEHYEDLCLIYKNLGRIQRRLNLFDKAMDNFNRSLDLYNQFLANGDEYHELRRGILESMARLHEATGNMTMAQECRAKKETASA